MASRWIWPFELIEKIGQGGMGVVYRARFVKDDRQVALKLLSPELISDATFLARFQREMDALKQLKHPNIVKCFGGVCETKQPFYAMELVEGGSVRRLLNKRGLLSWEQTLEFALQLCSALSFAHERGIIHRDVKPSNLLLTKSGKLKLSDFGLVYVTGATKLTGAGPMMGSLRYMAPERFHKDATASAQTDLYSLGCSLFEMISGQLPLQADTPAEIMHKCLEEPPPRLSALQPDCPAELDELVWALLQKEAVDRPASAAAVAQSLQGMRTVFTVKARLPEHGVSNKPTILKRPQLTMRGPQTRQGPLPAWAVWTSLLLVAVMVIWNVGLYSSLSETKHSLSQSEELLLKMYGSHKIPVRQEGASALGKLGRGTDAVIEALAKGLDDEKNDEVRKATIQALGELGPAAKRASSKLLALEQDDPNDDVRAAAGDALKRIRSAKSKWSYWEIVFWVGALIAAIAAIVMWLKKLAPPSNGGPESASDSGSGRPVDAAADQWVNTRGGRRK